MAVAGGEHQRPHSKGRQRLLFVLEENRFLDRGCYQYLVFKINLKDMFVPSAAGEEDDEEEDWAAAMRSFPRPVAQFDTLQWRNERLDLAVATGPGGGASIVAVSCEGRTVIHDAAAAAEVPCGRELRYRMSGGAILIPLGTQLYAVANDLWPPAGNSVPSFQALQPPSPAASRWSWRALPAPPRDLCKRLPFPAMPFCSVTAVLAAGNRVWVSAPDRGTFSFDTARLVWRKEGDWQLPFRHHCLFVPDLGLCFAICPHRFCLIAFDAPPTAAGAGSGKPPAIRYVWQDETYPRECQDRGFIVRTPRGLAYMGDGKFCITWTIGIEYAEQEDTMVVSRFALLLVAVQVVRGSPHCEESGELQLVKHKARCYKMSSHGIDGYVLQPALG